MNNRLKNIRKSLGMNQTDFANTVGSTQRSISSYESGTNPIPDVFIKSLCSIYDINEEWFRTGEGEMHPEPTIDGELAERFGDIMNEHTDESKREVIRAILELLDRIPSEYYPDISEFIEKLNRK